ncbi:MAG: SPFH domain-containing protein, partial [Methanomassiliicoccaceae archaeon]|nr:SPFH domain-containing protein [Methanomassiliicoccaceae archaeon]
PYKSCSHCGQPSPLMAPGQPAQAGGPAPAPAPAPAGGAGGGKAFKNCPYCGEDLGGLPKTPRFCPYCSEQIN